MKDALAKTRNNSKMSISTAVRDIKVPSKVKQFIKSPIYYTPVFGSTYVMERK